MDVLEHLLRNGQREIRIAGAGEEPLAAGKEERGYLERNFARTVNFVEELASLPPTQNRLFKNLELVELHKGVGNIGWYQDEKMRIDLYISCSPAQYFLPVLLHEAGHVLLGGGGEDSANLAAIELVGLERYREVLGPVLEEPEELYARHKTKAGGQSTAFVDVVRYVLDNHGELSSKSALPFSLTDKQKGEIWSAME